MIKDTNYSLEAEQAIIGSILIKPDLYEKSCGIISADDFYLENHKQIYGAITKLYTQSKSVDLVTLLDMISAQGNERNSNKDYLLKLADSVPVLEHIADYCEIIKSKAATRQARQMAQEFCEFNNPESTAAEQIQELAEKLANLVRQKDRRNSRMLSEIILSVHKNIFTLAEDKSLYTGISALDRLLDGIEPSDLITIGAGTGVGKTALVLQIIRHIARNGRKVKLYSQEMSGEQNVLRLLASQSGVALWKLRKYGRLQDDTEVNKVADICEELYKLPIEIDDCGGVTVEDIRYDSIRDKDTDVIVIDHVGLMRLPKGVKKNSRAEEISYTMVELRQLAMQIQKPIIILSQFNRDGQKTNKEPQLLDFKDGREIEQSLSAAILLWRTEDYEEKKIIGVKVAKNRQGEQGLFYMRFDGATMSFREVIDYTPEYRKKNKEAEEIF